MEWILFVFHTLMIIHYLWSKHTKLELLKFECRPTKYKHFQKHIICEGQTNTNYYFDATILMRGCNKHLLSQHQDTSYGWKILYPFLSLILRKPYRRMYACMQFSPSVSKALTYRYFEWKEPFNVSCYESLLSHSNLNSCWYNQYVKISFLFDTFHDNAILVIINIWNLCVLDCIHILNLNLTQNIRMLVA